jgi:hypothetical protein
MFACALSIPISLNNACSDQSLTTSISQCHGIPGTPQRKHTTRRRKDTSTKLLPRPITLQFLVRSEIFWCQGVALDAQDLKRRKSAPDFCVIVLSIVPDDEPGFMSSIIELPNDRAGLVWGAIVFLDLNMLKGSDRFRKWISEKVTDVLNVTLRRPEQRRSSWPAEKIHLIGEKEGSSRESL